MVVCAIVAMTPLVLCKQVLAEPPQTGVTGAAGGAGVEDGGLSNLLLLRFLHHV
jgi:hypothetical protein